MITLLWVCLGGAAGTGARYLVGLWAATRFGAGFAWGTLLVNVVGSFALALLMQLAEGAAGLSSTVRLALGAGVLGGFTTYSSFNYETIEYFRAGSWSLGAANAAATLVGSLVAGVGGLAVARWLSTS